MSNDYIVCRNTSYASVLLEMDPTVCPTTTATTTTTTYDAYLLVDEKTAWLNGLIITPEICKDFLKFSTRDHIYLQYHYNIIVKHEWRALQSV